MSVLDMPQDEYYRWLRDNHVVLGGTDIGAIIGLNVNRTATDVFDRKLALRPPVQRNRDMDRGIALEDVAATVYAREANAVLSTMRYLRHPEHAFLGGTPDRSIDRQPDHETPGILEIKCPRLHGYEQTLLHGVDQSYHCQLQWYMGLSGRSWGAFGIFNAERWELHRVDVDFDPTWYRDTLAAVVAFWHDHILTRRRPEGETRQDLLTSELPRVGAEWMQRTDADFIRACHAYASAKESQKLAEEHVKRSQARLEALLEPGSRVRGGGFQVTYLEHGRRTPDLEWLKREHPDLDLDRYIRQSVYRQLRLTRGQ
jgi:putative phage-type endonuclease